MTLDRTLVSEPERIADHLRDLAIQQNGWADLEHDKKTYIYRLDTRPMYRLIHG